MQYIELKNCDIESTKSICPACGNTLLQKLVPKATTLSTNFIYYLICPNVDCGFLGSPQVSQVETVYRRLSALHYKNIDFTSSIISGFDPLTVIFKVNNIGLSADTYNWDFGDGSSKTTTDTTVTHTYNVPGIYSVSLSVYDIVDHKNFFITKNDLINVSSFIPATAYFSVDKTSGNNTLECQFTDLSTGSNIIKWDWDFGDGSISNEQNPKHKYTYYGYYTVTLTVTNSKYQTNTLTKPNLINIALTAPVAKFTQTEVAGYTPLTVTFTYSGAGEYFPDSFKWHFGDGATSTEQNPTHTYTTAGIYNVQLEVYNAMGSDAVIKSNAVIVEAPKVI